MSKHFIITLYDQFKHEYEFAYPSVQEIDKIKSDIHNKQLQLRNIINVTCTCKDISNTDRMHYRNELASWIERVRI